MEKIKNMILIDWLCIDIEINSGLKSSKYFFVILYFHLYRHMVVLKINKRLFVSFEPLRAVMLKNTNIRGRFGLGEPRRCGGATHLIFRKKKIVLPD